MPKPVPLKTFLVDPAELSEDRSGLDEATEPFKVKPLSATEVIERPSFPNDNSRTEVCLPAFLHEARAEAFGRTEEDPHIRWRLPSSLLN